MTAETPSPEKPTSGRKRRRTWLVGLVAAVCLLSVLPTIVARTPLRNVLLNRVLAKRQMHGSVKRLSAGWWTPVRVDGVALQRDDGRLQARLDRLELERSWLSTLWRSPDLGGVVLQSPTIDVRINSSPPYWQPVPNAAARRDLTTEVVIRNGTLRVTADDGTTPLLLIERIDLTARVAPSNGGRVLEIEPVDLLSDQELKPELFGQGLQLIAPVLAKSTAVSGRTSLRIDRFQMPLDGADQQEQLAQGTVKGTLSLHQVTASLRDSTIVQVVDQLANLFGIELPADLRLVDDTVVSFELRDGRVFHDGLAFLIPEISPDLIWRTRGSVGLDESLDLEIEVKLPLGDLSDTPLLQSLADSPIRFRVGGTIDDPQIGPVRDISWLQTLGTNLLDALRRRRELRRRESPEEGRPRRRGILRRRE